MKNTSKFFLVLLLCLSSFNLKSEASIVLHPLPQYDVTNQCYRYAGQRVNLSHVLKRKTQLEHVKSALILDKLSSAETICGHEYPNLYRIQNEERFINAKLFSGLDKFNVDKKESLDIIYNRIHILKGIKMYAEYRIQDLNFLIESFHNSKKEGDYVPGVDSSDEEVIRAELHSAKEFLLYVSQEETQWNILLSIVSPGVCL